MSERPVQAGAESDLAYNLKLLDASVGLVRNAEQAGLRPRLLGGLAIAAHLPDPAVFVHRRINDIDLFVVGAERRRLAQFITDYGYQPEPRFNALNGHRRMLFHGPDFEIDVLVREFDMCHRLNLEGRVDLDDPTIPVADLLLTKLQIVQLNEKDATDVSLLVEHHDIGEGPGDHIELSRIVETAADDWGWWRTLHLTSERLAESASQTVRERLTTILQAIDAAPKSLGWRTRDRVGDRKRWYEIPEEVGR